MNRDSLAKMRLDRRLVRRRGWLLPAELEESLEALPDVAAKATTVGEVEEGDEREDRPGERPPLA